MTAADVVRARAWLREHLPQDEPIELADSALLDRVVALLVARRASP